MQIKREDLPDDILAHYGVKGMKWGVRKQADGSKAKTGSSSDYTTGYKPKTPGKEAKTRSKKSKEPKHLRGEEVLNTKLDSGGSLIVRTSPPGPIAKALASKFKSIREVQEKVHDFTLSNEKNEKVGEASFTQTSKDTLELEWIGVRKAHRKKGYATAAMQGVIEYAKDHDITTLNLTATDMGSGIYESLGFKKVGVSEYYDGVYQMTIPKRIKHSSSNDFEIDPKLFGEYIKNSLNKNLSRKDGTEMQVTREDLPDDILAHYGVKGMKWGVRKDRRTGVPRGTARAAKKDAKEYTRAKMYYGEGAGTRRKLINARVQQRSKDASYKKAFGQYVETTDMAKRGSEARRKRVRTDLRKGTAKTFRGTVNTVRGQGRRAGAVAFTIGTAGVMAYKLGGDKYVKKYAPIAYSKMMNSNTVKRGSEFIKNMYK